MQTHLHIICDMCLEWWRGRRREERGGRRERRERKEQEIAVRNEHNTHSGGGSTHSMHNAPTWLCSINLYPFISQKIIDAHTALSHSQSLCSMHYFLVCSSHMRERTWNEATLKKCTTIVAPGSSPWMRQLFPKGEKMSLLQGPNSLLSFPVPL